MNSSNTLMNSCIQSLMNSSIKQIDFFWLCSYVSSLGTIIHKQELFVMAIRTPIGKIFPGNYTIIPSSKKWVFHSIFRLAFLSLYGEHVCSINVHHVGVKTFQGSQFLRCACYLYERWVPCCKWIHLLDEFIYTWIHLSQAIIYKWIPLLMLSWVVWIHVYEELQSTYLPTY